VFQLFFDLDGTLTDPAPGITACLAYAAERLGHSAPSAVELQRYIGPPLREAFADLLETKDAVVIEDAVRLYRERFSTIGIFENAVYPGVEQSLDQLWTDGFALSVVTSKPEVYASRIIDHFGLRRFFARVYGAELSGERSTKSELIAQALESQGVAPSRACMIGDREHDILGAAAQGVAAIGVTWGYGTAEELRRAGACAVIDTLEQLVAVCRRLGGGAPTTGP
jgi:phosphoglycolate phosphatase